MSAAEAREQADTGRVVAGPASRLAIVAVLTALVLAAACGLLFAGNRGVYRSGSDFVAEIIHLPVGLFYVAMGAIVVVRRPGNLLCWLLVAFGLLIAFSETTKEWAIYTLLSHPGSFPGGQVMAWLGQWPTNLFLPGGFALLFILFPDGRVPSRRWLALVCVTLIGVVVTTLTAALAPKVPLFGGGSAGSGYVDNPFAARGARSTLMAINEAAWLTGLAAVLIASVGNVFRMRRARADLRQQLKWLAYFSVIDILLVVALIVGSVVAPTNSEAGGIVFTATAVSIAVTIPLAIAIAVSKYHLYGIDVVISRTIVYAVLAALITGVYVGIAVGIGELVGSAGKPNLGLSILATAIVAVGFQPARERLQRVANRLVYGKRATPYQVLSEFSSHVAGSYAADEVLPRMARVLQEGTGAATATVWLRSGDALHASAVWPESTARDGEAPLPVNGRLPAIPGVTQAVEVRHQGELLGALTIVKRRGESLTPVEEKLLNDLAHQAGLVLKNVGLTADLQRRLEELRLSRQRLVSAQDEERRRLERNLHDGAQQHLVALKVKLGLAEMLAARDPEKAKQTIAELKADTDEALETLRDLARGIYPPLLAEKGLVTALESQARKATLPVEVDAEGIGRYPQELEATVYFCVLEALQNVQKYACASQATVQLREVDRALRFEVADDGRGFDVENAKPGAGLSNMRDRLDALEGDLEIVSAPDHGARVVGRLPLTAPALVG